MFLKLLTVFGLGALDLWVAVLMGFVLKLHPILVGALSAAGATTPVLIIVFLGDRVRRRIMARRATRPEGRRAARVRRILERYGPPGLGLLSPLLLGFPLGTAIGIALGAKPLRLFVWMAAGILLWSAALTAALAAGIIGVKALLH